jgi:hypothetical protein
MIVRRQPCQVFSIAHQTAFNNIKTFTFNNIKKKLMTTSFVPNPAIGT